MSVIIPSVIQLMQVNEGNHLRLANEYPATQDSVPVKSLNGLAQGNGVALLEALKLVSIIIDERQPEDDIRAAVLLRQRASEVELTGIDGDLQIRKTVPVTWAQQDFCVAVNADKLFRMLCAVGDSQVELTHEAGKLHILGSGISYWLRSIPVGKFPLAKPVIALARSTLSVPRNLFKGLLDQVQHAMALDDARNELNGMLLVTENRQLTLAATDGLRLASGRIDLGMELPRLKAIVPALAVRELARLLRAEPDTEVQLDIRFAQGRVSFKTNASELVTELIPGIYPDVGRVASEAYAGEFTVYRAHLMLGIHRATLVGSKEGVELALEEGQPLAISGLDTEGCGASVTLPVNYRRGGFMGRFHASHLTDALAKMPHDEVVVQFDDARPSILLKAKGAEAVKHVVSIRR